MWVWLKNKDPGLRRFSLLFHLPGFHFGPLFLIHGHVSRAKYSCVKKRSYELAFADPFAMLSRPHVLLSRALFSLELLSRRFRGGLPHSMQAFAGLSRRDLPWLLSR